MTHPAPGARRTPGPAKHRPPLPVRDGLNPTRLVLPHDPEVVVRFPFALDYLLDRFRGDADRLLEKLALGEIVTGHGEPLTPTTPYEPRGFLYLYRDPPAHEDRIPFEPEVLHRDENLLVVDKPHFLATMPRGRWVRETALVRLRVALDLPELSPAHRLDRGTAGVLVFTVRPEVRGAYQEAFARRKVRKVYEAVAPLPSSGAVLPSGSLPPSGDTLPSGGTRPDGARVALGEPVTLRSRIVKRRGVTRAEEVPGEPNAESLIILTATDEARGLGLYRLEPHTGKTHQLRLHMASLGLPILHDPFWPDLRDTDPDDFDRPLQLLSRSLELTDPLSGRTRRFESRRTLSEWTHRSPG
ncbi:tRNA pseudouridine32 synthase / 23S rRNA pseudouridine746 synthase [Promicromonospora sp. AC04]|uniref:pseudouridine synthase n=1 Tax=Promicromonospora sp. AC04 TaxID=2135723 RepID=UPI000D345E28|nr:pseudouridine synthase [Promicromonospora sp. AC04]PUB30019.1 tRNA pseudouridine32 synthase / 23S rRNA pseudouridine746 synthase [Promicromonospora sp. AC04]